MNAPFNDKYCPHCRKRQLVALQIDTGKNFLGTVFFYCDECYEIYASEGITDKHGRLDIVQFTGIKSTVHDTIEFYETLMQFYKLLGEYLNTAAHNNRLMLMGLHAATILKYEAWGTYEDCAERVDKLRKFEDDQKKKRKRRR